jgi:hypothetical protein
MTVKHGFQFVRELDIPELNTRARLLRHVKTGAELLSLENDDENKVFGITFRTPPHDSTGVPHIMEHAVLCGSRKYPVKEPFVELVKGSMNTFVNAFTFPDKTCYPVASTNLQDFYNLIDVYLDAVFYPLIPPLTLDQEGWHYELEALEAPLSFKGVVYNEMKGSYSSPDRVLGHKSQSSLYPDNPYRFDSGGDPEKILDLTYDQFKSFHENYYHPSNARIYFYGDDDPDERLSLLDEYLKDFKAHPIDSSVPLQPRLDSPRRLVVPYEPGGEAESGDGPKAYLTVNWLLPEGSDPQTTLGLGILSHILVATPASPLRKALIDSGLGEDLVGGGLEDELRQMNFSTGMKGVAVQDTGKVEALILDTLSGLARDGIDPETVAASLNTLEFRLRENNTGSYPRGLLLMLRALSTWLHEGDPFASLAFEQPMSAIKHRVNSGERYFENLIHTHLNENHHRTTVILEPDPELGKRREAAEKERLERARAALREAERQALVENTRRLKLRQETPDTAEALATIPHLGLKDLDQENKRIPLDVTDQAGCQLLYHDLFTNGIVYLDVGLNLHCLDQEYLPYVSLFGRALLEMGTEAEDFVRLSQRIGRSTGGIRPATFLSTIRQRSDSTAWMFLRGKATLAQGDDLLQILQDVLLTPRLDHQERFRQIVLEEKAGYESGLVPAGHRIVNTRLRAHFNEADWATEQTSGISYLFFLRKLVEEVEKDWPAVLQRLETIHRALLNRNAMVCNVTVDGAGWSQFQPKLASFLGRLPAPVLDEAAPGPQVNPAWRTAWSTGDEGLTIPAQLNYVGKGANLYQLGYALDGSIMVISNYLRTTWLWERVRVRGGAYGGFCVFDHRSGILTFLSYRDPNLLDTLKVYDQTHEFLRGLHLSQDELTKSIIGVISDLDAYQLPDAKGYTSMLRYLAGDTEESRQRLRDQVLSTSQEDFHAFAETLALVQEKGQVVVLGPQDTIVSANEGITREANGSQPLAITRVM